MKPNLAIFAAVYAALAIGPASAATYTWIQGGDASNWDDAANWDANGRIPTDEANADLVFSASATGNIASSPNTAIATVGTLTTNSAVRLDNFGNWNTNSQTGLIFDTGDGSNATVSISGGLFQTYYTPQTLDVDVDVMGGKWLARSYGPRWGVRGDGGYIIHSGAELEWDGTHGTDNFQFTGGVTVLNGGIYDVDQRMGQLGTGLVTVEEGGQVQGANNSFPNDALFDVNSAGANPAVNTAFISGAGANWNAAGTWTFDLTDAGTTIGNSWQIISGAATYDAGFSIAGFTLSAGTWTGMANGVTYEFDPATGILSVIPDVAAGPEIAVEQPTGTDLMDGALVDFGSVDVGNNTVLTFTILNTGTVDLTLDGTAPDYVAVSGADAGAFVVTSQPTTPVAASGSTTFEVTFTPTSADSHSATLTIANNDSDENPFTIDVTGNNNTFTWIQGGDPLEWADPLNWEGGLVPPSDQADANLIFSASATGNIASNPNTATVTVGAITTNSAVRMENFGDWNSNSQTGLIFDTGDGSNATVSISGGLFQTYYTPQTLDVDVDVMGGKWLARSYGPRWGVRGDGGYIIHSGAELEWGGTHGTDNFQFTGGVTVLNGGIYNVDQRMGQLGTGLVTVEEGGQVQGANNSFPNDALFDVNSTGANPAENTPFINGAGANWNAAGTWEFDLADSGAIPGNQWQIISGAASYDGAFSVTSNSGAWTESGGVWTGIESGVVYSFDTATGILEVISASASITSFEAAGATGVIDYGANTISLTVPFGTDLATLAPTFTLSSGTCDQTSGSPPSPTFAAQNPVDYVVTDGGTVNTYSVTVTVAPETATIVIDLGAGTEIKGGEFIGTGPTNLPLPAVPAGSILKSIDVDLTLDATDNDNFASDFALLFDPTPGTPGGDFSVGISRWLGSAELTVATEVEWDPATGEGGAGTTLVDTLTDSDWVGNGPIDLSTTGLFLGNNFDLDDQEALQGGTWTGTITLTYEVGTGGGSDYDTWAAGFLPDDVSDPAGDFDKDGLTNDEERAFGLNPTDPSSVDPFSVPVDENGAFSYSRRDPALSGLTYSIWTSTDLAIWTEDTGAVQTPGAVAGESQDVAVTTSAAPVDGKLFIEVRAD